MLLTSLAVAALLAPLPTVSAAAPTPRVAIEDAHGKLPWFKGTFEEALAQAKSKNQLVFIDFWTDWCGWCKRMDKDTFSDDSVVAEMKDIITLSVDAESETGMPIAKRYGVKGYPALILLNPDGSARDSIGGYLKPDDFKAAIQRVRSDKGTVGDLKRRSAADPKNVELLDELAQKLRSLGDEDGAKEVDAAIVKVDPEGKSLPMRRAAFDKLMAQIDSGWNESKTLDVNSVVAFLEKETHAEILFQGWYSVYQMHGYLAQEAAKKNKPEDAKQHEVEGNKAMRLIWKYCSTENQPNLGPQIALDFYERRAKISADDKVFALEVAKTTHAATPENPGAVAALACAQFLNGSKDDAIKNIQHAIELDPANEKWKSLLAEFQAGS